GCPGTFDCDKSIAEAKGWLVMDFFYDDFNRANGTPGDGYEYAGLRPDIWANRVGGGYNASSVKNGYMRPKALMHPSLDIIEVTATIYDLNTVYPAFFYVGDRNDFGDGADNYLYLSVLDGGIYVFDENDTKIEEDTSAYSAQDEVRFRVRRSDGYVWVMVNEVPALSTTTSKTNVSGNVTIGFKSSSSGSSPGIDNLWIE